MIRLLARRATSVCSNLCENSCRGSTVQLLTRRGFCFGVLPDGVDRNSEVFATNSKAMEDLISELQSHVKKVSFSLYFSLSLFSLCIYVCFGLNNWFMLKVLAGGGAEAVKRNRSRNKLLPRERIDRLLDCGSSFLELSQVSLFVFNKRSYLLNYIHRDCSKFITWKCLNSEMIQRWPRH